MYYLKICWDPLKHLAIRILSIINDSSHFYGEDQVDFSRKWAMQILDPKPCRLAKNRDVQFPRLDLLPCYVILQLYYTKYQMSLYVKFLNLYDSWQNCIITANKLICLSYAIV